MYFYYEFFDRAREAIKSRRLRWQILKLVYFPGFVFKENHVFNDNPSQKVVIVEKELDDVDIDDFVNLEDLPELVFIDEECGNPKSSRLMVESLKY